MERRARHPRPRHPAPSGRQRRGGGERALPRPRLPRGVAAHLPAEVAREIREHARAADRADVALALQLGAACIDDDQPERALEYLTWAASRVPRAPSVREALGVARYLTGDFAGALRELLAYRRLSGRTDQNHLIADCQRALGRDPARIAAYVEEMDPVRDGRDRWLEGRIVWASTLADHGDIDGAQAVLAPALAQTRDADPEECDLRVWYVAADLERRRGAIDRARRWWQRIAAVAPDFHDVAEQLRAAGG